jgi:hypothetical protein
MRPPSHMPLAEMMIAPNARSLMRIESSRESVKRSRPASGSFAWRAVMRVAARAIGEST